MNLMERAKAPTPKFFKILRNAGIALLGIGGAVISSPVSLPAAVVSIAGYLVVGGSILSAVSQLAVDDKKVIDRYFNNEE